ncbi:MAG: NlpC/P60 family protein [Hyphomicrobiaceae bacterium]|nr:NlpC/P60 family protein [Hyphomicrobiaceae bacterium]
MSGVFNAGPSRAEIVRLARGWIGTPYHHQASRRGVGTDCLGLVRGVWREVYGTEPEAMQPYTSDWSACGAAETLLAAARRHFHEIAQPGLRAGNVVVFRYRTGHAARHCGIIGGSDSFIHAMERVPASEVALSDWWRRRIAGVFEFPGVSD